MENKKEIFSENLKFYLQRNSKTAKQLADDLNFKTSTVYDWVNGRTYPRMPKLEAIAEYLNVSANDLIYPKDQLNSISDINTKDLNFGQRLRFLRKNKNETQKDIAKLLGLTQTAINGYETENRQPDQASLIKLANHYNVSTDYLLTGKNKNDFSQEQQDAFRKEIVDEDTNNMAAHSTNKDVSSRGIDPKEMAEAMDEFFSTPEGKAHLQKLMSDTAFNIDENDLNE